MSDPPESESAPPQQSRVLWKALAASLLLWLAQPPLALWPLAWLAPIGWLLIANTKQRLSRSGYAKLWLAGVVYWLLAVHWIRLPHPLTPIGWFFLAAYLGCYLPTFIWVARQAVHHRGVPLWIAAPIAWTGLEFLQAHLFSGFLMGAISHSQHGIDQLVASSSWVGAYSVSFLVMLGSSVITVVIFDRGRFGGNEMPPPRTALGACALGLFGAILGFQGNSSEPTESVRVAIIQGDTRATWDPDPDRNRKIMDRQVALSLQAVAQADTDGKPLDLVIWPESMFRPPLITFDGSTTPPDDVEEHTLGAIQNTRDWCERLAKSLGAPLLVGLDRFDYPASTDDPDNWAEIYNSAGFIDADGQLLATYDKTHLVPFGEYIPLAKGMPALYYLTPMAGGMASGAGPVAMPLALAGREPITLCPSICFETVVPHVIRRQVAELTARGESPQLLVNVTNDAWFWGSSELDMHLRCARYRAAETGTPLVVAANGGLSAVIDHRGKVLAAGPRMQEHVLIADVPLRASAAPTPYVRYGDWFAGACLALCGIVAALAARQWRHLDRK